MPKRSLHRCIAKRCVAALQGREASRSDRSKTTVRSTSAQTRRQSSPTSIMPVRSRKRTGAGLAMTWPRPLPHRQWTPHLHRDWAHPCHICAGTRLTAAARGGRYLRVRVRLQRSAASTSGNSTCTCRQRTACHSPLSFCEYNTLQHDATPNNILQRHATLQRHNLALTNTHTSA